MRISAWHLRHRLYDNVQQINRQLRQTNASCSRPLSMEEKTSFRDRFREARQKRGLNKGTSSTVRSIASGLYLCLQAPLLKRYREPITKDTATTSKEATEDDEGDGLTKEERDRILMPPPPPLSKKPKQSIQEPSPSPPPVQAPSTTEDPRADTIPDDFFEVQNKRTSTVLDRQREEERTETELLRFQQELEMPLESMAEREAEEEEQNEIRRQEIEEHEQRQRLHRVTDLLRRRQGRSMQPLSTDRTSEQGSSSTSGLLQTLHMAAADEDDASSDEDVEAQWRGKGLT